MFEPHKCMRACSNFDMHACAEKGTEPTNMYCQISPYSDVLLMSWRIFRAYSAQNSCSLFSVLFVAANGRWDKSVVKKKFTWRLLHKCLCTYLHTYILCTNICMYTYIHINNATYIVYWFEADEILILIAVRIIPSYISPYVCTCMYKHVVCKRKLKLKRKENFFKSSMSIDFLCD